MAHIVRFRVTGLAGNQKPLECELHKDINVFFGDNGSGKTSLLRILNAALKAETASLGRVPFQSAEVVIHSTDYDRDFTYYLDKGDLPKARSVPRGVSVADEDGTRSYLRNSKQVKWHITPKLPNGSAGRWRSKYLPTSRLYELVRGEPRVRSRSPKSPESFEHTVGVAFENFLQREWLSFYGEMQSRIAVSQHKALAEILKEVLAPEDIKSDQSTSIDEMDFAYGKVREFLRRHHPRAKMQNVAKFRERFEGSYTLRRTIQHINKVELKREEAMLPQTKLQDLVERMFKGRKSLRVGEMELGLVSGDDTMLELSSLSSGERQLLYILFAVLQAGKSCVIIDEPELSMHIDWQRDFVHSVLELAPEVQLLLATHSPEIMAHLDDSRIIRI